MWVIIRALAFRKLLVTPRMARMDTRQHAALLYSINEFQKAQSFFIIMFHSAALVCLFSSSNGFELQSLEAVQLATKGLRVVASLQLATCSFGHHVLVTSQEPSKELSWYLMILGFGAECTALATWIASSQPLRMHMLRARPSGSSFIDSDGPCGDVAPSRFCVPPLDAYNNISTHTAWENFINPLVVASSLLLYLGLIFYQIHKWSSKRKSGLDLIAVEKTSYQNLDKRRLLGRTKLIITSKLFRWLRSAISGLFELWLAVAVVLTLTPILDFYKRFRSDAGSWTIGQMLSVAIWVPLFIECVEALFRKIDLLLLYFCANVRTGGLNHSQSFRIHRPYRIVHTYQLRDEAVGGRETCQLQQPMTDDGSKDGLGTHETNAAC